MSGCAGSANHDVLSSHRAQDESLSCEQIDEQIVRAQVVIDDVAKDKEDISGADIVDGVLWFPFNLIAKSANYKEATEAAGKRIARLQALKETQQCADAKVAGPDSEVRRLAQELNRIAEMYRSGQLTEDEYKAAKSKALGL